MPLQEYFPLVRKIAYHLLSRLPANVLLEDLIQAGSIGLMEAEKNFDDSKGASFETYAGIRIRGAMLDEIRKGDWSPRSVHRNTRTINETIQEMEQQQGGPIKESEVAKKLDLSLEEYRKMQVDSSGVHVCSLEDLGESGLQVANHKNHPLEEASSAEFRSDFSLKLKNLPDREKMVISLYYDSEMNLKEIGALMGVSESRVSQMHSQALHKLKGRLSGWA